VYVTRVFSETMQTRLMLCTASGLMHTIKIVSYKQVYHFDIAHKDLAPKDSMTKKGEE